MATYEEAMTALRNADKAGDTVAAKRLAGIARQLKDSGGTPAEPVSAGPQDIPGGGLAGNRNVGKPDNETMLQKMEGGVEAAGATLAGVAAPVIGAAAGLGSRLFQQNGPKAAEGVANRVSDTIGQAMRPPSEAGQRYAGQIGEAFNASGLGALGPMGAELGAAGRMAPPAMAQAARGIGKVTAPVANVGRDLMGSKIPGAQAEAFGAARGALESGASGLEQSAQAATSKAGTLGQSQAKLEANLAKLKQPGANTLDAIGDTVRSGYEAAIDSAETERSSNAGKLYGAAAEQAKATVFDTSALQKKIAQFRETAKGNTASLAQIDQLEQAFLPKAEAPPVAAPKILSAQGVPLPPSKTPTVAPASKTYDQLSFGSRKMKDIGYAGQLDGFDGIGRGWARELSKLVDQEIADKVPLHKEAAAQYRMDSEALGSVNTRIGRALTGTEGGLSKDVMNKVPAEKLPAKLFSDKEALDAYTEALAGGPRATPEALTKAKERVNDMYEKYITESTRQGSGKQGLSALNAPGVQGVARSVPKAVESVTQRLESRSALENSLNVGSDRIKDLTTQSGKAQAASNKIREDLGEALRLSELPDKVSKTKGLQEMRAALKRANEAGVIPKEKYEAAIDLFNRTETLENRSLRVRNIGKWLAVLVGAGQGAHILGKTGL